MRAMSKRNYEISPVVAHIIAESFRLVTDTVGVQDIFCDIFDGMSEGEREELEDEIHRVVAKLREHGDLSKTIKEK